ncbi:MAG TPA: hypothetical protein VIY30_16100 [Burkholderiaceae bacterium]
MQGVVAMRRGIEIRVAFAPTRSSAMHLRAAYAVVSPTAERTIVAADERVVDDEEDGSADVEARRRKTGDNQ